MVNLLHITNQNLWHDPITGFKTMTNIHTVSIKTDLLYCELHFSTLNIVRLLLHNHQHELVINREIATCSQVNSIVQSGIKG